MFHPSFHDSILLQVPINVLNERFITVRFVCSAFFWCARVESSRTYQYEYHHSKLEANILGEFCDDMR